MSSLLRFFDSITIDDVPQVGGKNASLGEMVRELSGRGVPVPNGFATTAEAYRLFLGQEKLAERIAEVLAPLRPEDVDDLADRGERVRRLILAAEIPPELAREIAGAYRHLSATYGEETTDVAVRSSATAEDLPDASFAGQQETFLNIRGETELLAACKRCIASLFTNRAISYRAQRGIDHNQVALSIGVQKMVRSDLGASGVIFTLDTETGFPDVVLITASWGLGENIVRGVVNPDEVYVFKPTLAQGFRPILQKRLGSKEMKLIYDARGGSQRTRNVPVPASDRKRFAVSDDEILKLARWSVLIEEHYSARAGHKVPMDIEWARDGRTGELFILQARPETVQSRRDPAALEMFKLEARTTPIVSGRSVGAKIGCGPARVIRSLNDMGEFQEGDVLVTEMTDPDWVPILKKASAIVTERGGRTCHAAIVSRELGIPAVIGADHAQDKVPDGREVTVSCAEGETGYVYPGRLAFKVEKVSLAGRARPKTKIMMNVGDPDLAFDLSFLPNDGVGLARMELIINNTIHIHPMALVRYPGLEDREAVKEIERLTEGYADKKEYFVDRLAQGIAKLAAAFYPKDVILRLSDFKTNEYARLVGGKAFEPPEENPMLGFRGASRYSHPLYRPGFALECAAIRRVREEMGLTNLKVMVPFCRTPDEGRKVLAVMQEEGLARGENGLEVYVMCEIPSNVVRARDFAAVFDGFSIGSNDLTQLVLGVDRDSSVVAPLFDERDPAVTTLIRQVIAEARRAGRKIGICGQAPSDYPEFAAFLVDCGIDSISLNPDAVLATTTRVADYEAARIPAEAPAAREPALAAR
jgi:pyruvate, water dikinase